MKNKERIFWISISIFLISFIAFPIKKAKAISVEGEKFLQIFHEIEEYIESDYVEVVEDKSLYIGAIRGMLSALGDPHSRFMSEEEYRSLQEETRGSFGGVGLEVTHSEGSILVISPYDDTPASKAGILPQDRILEISTKSTEKMPIEEAIKLMRGPAGTNVTIRVRRKNVKDPFLVTLTRELIKINYLKSIYLENEKVGYLRLTQFMGRENNTLGEFRKIISDFVAKDPNGIILDLRSNPGGLLDLAVDLSDMFLRPGQDIVSVKGRGEKLIKVFKSVEGKEKFLDVPIVVLLNNGSASASEILAGALQDNKRAIILGNQSFGKGSVQHIYNLQHKTGMALTIQKYYTPSGVSIHKKGITPDVVVNQITPDTESKIEMEKLFKTNLVKTFIKENPGYTEKNVKGFQDLLQKKTFKINKTISRMILKRENSIGEKAPILEREFDPQVNKAIEILANPSLTKPSAQF
jgi:carboxyl-terminal processing protease